VARYSPQSINRARGFSLLEILVAFTLLALAMGVLMQLFSRGVNGASLADRYARATMMAESKLATIGVEEEPREGDSRGIFDDDYRWQLSVKPYVDAGLKDAAASLPSPLDPDAQMRVRLYDLALTVSFTGDDRRERSVTLKTLLMAARK